MADNNNTPPKPRVKIIKRPNLSTWTWQKIITSYIPYTWENIFAKITDERTTIAEMFTTKILPHRKEIFPLKEDVYKAFELTPLPRIKVVIIGQDPYPQRGRDGSPKAQGLSFSVSPTDDIPGSLRNIYKELAAEYPETFITPKHGDLRDWARQGVLLLNMALTVPEGERNAHKGLWKPFIVKIVSGIVDANPDTIFVLWGNDAMKVKPLLRNAPILESGHPSPEAVNRGGNFMGNGHFKKINEILEERGEAIIDWQI